MSKIRNRTIGLGVVLLLLLAAGIAVQVTRRQPPTTVQTPTQPAPPTTLVPATPPDAPRVQSRFYVPPRSTPDELHGFGDLSQTKRLNLVTEKMDNRQLPPAVLRIGRTSCISGRGAG